MKLYNVVLKRIKYVLVYIHLPSSILTLNGGRSKTLIFVLFFEHRKRFNRYEWKYVSSLYRAIWRTPNVHHYIPYHMNSLHCRQISLPKANPNIKSSAQCFHSRIKDAPKATLLIMYTNNIKLKLHLRITPTKNN